MKLNISDSFLGKTTLCFIGVEETRLFLVYGKT